MKVSGQPVFIRHHGCVSGPHTLAQVYAMISSGRLGVKAEWSVDQHTWYPLSVLSPQKNKAVDPTRSLSPYGPESSREPDKETAGKEFFSSDAVMATGKVFPAIKHDYRLSPGMILIIILAMSPLFLFHYVTNIAQAAWFMMGYFSVIWGVVFYFILRPDEDLRNRGLLYALFTCFIGIPILMLWHRFPVIRLLTARVEQEAGAPEVELLAWILGVGLLEETIKAMPLLVFALSPKIIRTLRDGVWLGILSGLGFALAEGVDYSYRYWNTAALYNIRFVGEAVERARDRLGQIQAEQLEAQIEHIMPELMGGIAHIMTIQIARWISLSMLHAAWSGLAGYCIAYAYLYSNWIVFVVGLAGVAVLHGVYNFFSGSLIAVLVGAFSVAALLIVVRQSQWQMGVIRRNGGA